MPLSSTQKTLIGVGAVGVAGFAVWRLFFYKKDEPVNVVQDFTPTSPSPLPNYYDSFIVSEEKRQKMIAEQETPITDSMPDGGVPQPATISAPQPPPPPRPRPATAITPAQPAQNVTPTPQTSFIIPRPSAEQQPIPVTTPETYITPPSARTEVTPEGTSGPETPMPTERLATPKPVERTTLADTKMYDEDGNLIKRG